MQVTCTARNRATFRGQFCRCAAGHGLFAGQSAQDQDGVRFGIAEPEKSLVLIMNDGKIVKNAIPS